VSFKDYNSSSQMNLAMFGGNAKAATNYKTRKWARGKQRTPQKASQAISWFFGKKQGEKQCDAPILWEEKCKGKSHVKSFLC
jgi:hypothetical protein